MEEEGSPPWLGGGPGGEGKTGGAERSEAKSFILNSLQEVRTVESEGSCVIFVQ